MIRIGLVGIGGMGTVHYNEYKKIDTAKVVAVADVRADMAKEKTQKDNVSVYDSMDSLLSNEQIDMIDICTPSYLHAELAIKALEAGKHVICEKPMSINTQECERIIRAASKSGKLFMTAHVVRFMKAYEYLKNIIDTKEFGNPVHFDMKRISSIPRWSFDDWMRDVSKSGASPIDLSIHDIDFIQYVFGEPKKVLGARRIMTNDNDYIVSELVYDDFDVSITGGWFNCDIPFRAQYLAIFENGYVEYSGGKIIKNGQAVEIKKENDSKIEGINISGADGYYDELVYFIDCIKKNIKPDKVTPESSKNSVALVEKIREISVNI